MHRIFILIALSCVCVFAQAKEYGHYDARKILVESVKDGQKSFRLDMDYMDNMIADLANHAMIYPPKFDSSEDQQRAAQDVQIISGMLDVLVNSPKPSHDILTRMGMLQVIGYNLDIPDAGQSATQFFTKFLMLEPEYRSANYLYGIFLSSSGRFDQAQPLLEKAIHLGEPRAHHALGANYLMQGNQKKAIEEFEAHQKLYPRDENIAGIIDAIKSGRIEHQSAPAEGNSK